MSRNRDGTAFHKPGEVKQTFVHKGLICLEEGLHKLCGLSFPMPKETCTLLRCVIPELYLKTSISVSSCFDTVPQKDHMAILKGFFSSGKQRESFTELRKDLSI